MSDELETVTDPVDQTRYYDFEVRDADDDARTISGLAAPYGVKTPLPNYEEVLERGVFSKSIEEAGRNLPLLAFHESRAFPVGKSIAWEETDEGLFGTWEMAKHEVARTAYEQIRDGFLGGLSVGFAPISGKSDVSGGSKTTPPVVTRREARLLEVSVVATPASKEARISLVRSAPIVVPTPRLDAYKRWWEARQ